MTDSYPAFIVNVEVALWNGTALLITERSSEEALGGGLLAFPGGKVEHSEDRRDTLEAAARREASEEIGVVPGDLVYAQSFTFEPRPGRHVLDIVLAARSWEGDPHIKAPREIADLRWMTPDEVVARDNCPPWLAASVAAVAKVV
ncbi:NUDIX hydrolase [Salininema proteolyticum]|uniref:NUDIX hydrolase n=1 Tax=Salininema proteolyticum TaxID=1607685 RepID=A0ABV8U085_9ACTN